MPAMQIGDFTIKVSLFLSSMIFSAGVIFLFWSAIANSDVDRLLMFANLVILGLVATIASCLLRGSKQFGRLVLVWQSALWVALSIIIVAFGIWMMRGGWGSQIMDRTGGAIAMALGAVLTFLLGRRFLRAPLPFPQEDMLRAEP
jgi:hypothetical protein